MNRKKELKIISTFCETHTLDEEIRHYDMTKVLKSNVGKKAKKNENSQARLKHIELKLGNSSYRLQVKDRRAYGGSLGTQRRRRTEQTPKCVGEP